MEQRDPRFTDAAKANLTQVYTLTGAPLKVDSVDAGWRLTLPGPAGESLQLWDGRGQHWLSTYDEQLRVLTVGVDGEPPLETFTYADVSADAGHNLRGQMTALHDPSGALAYHGYGLLGAVQNQTRTFDDARPHRSHQTFGPLNQLLMQIDAGDHRQTLHYDLAGQLKQVWLLRASSEPAQAVVQDATYNAAGQLTERLTGNNVRSRWQYDPANGRLASLQAAVAGQPPLQHFDYVYDPVGNVLRIEDLTFQPVYFANQFIDGHRDFDYDSLYRLTRASGHDVLPTADLPGRPQPSDPANLRNYTQHYDYDSGGNLIKLVHGREVGGYTRQMLVDPASNRALRWQTGDPTPDFAMYFDPHGNQRKLQHGPQLQWNAHDQLQQVTLLKHDNGLPDDREVYLYSQGGRVSKRHESHTASTTHFLQVRYLPGLEIRTRDNGEELHVISLPGNVRCLHWQAKPPADIDNNQLRYSLDDHLGSSLLELDQQARVISRETYYPFGGTALWLPSSSVAVDYKTVRYSGKEMDVSGLYYYGSRYYAPWLQRWVSADPAGDVDGLNLYAMVGNNPMVFVDPTGEFKGIPQLLMGLVGIIGKAKTAADQLAKLADEFDGLVAPDADINELQNSVTLFGFLKSRHGLKSAVYGAGKGALIGGAIGTAVPGVGNGIGMAAGAVVGAILFPLLRYYFFKNALKAAQVLHTKELQKGLGTLETVTNAAAEGAQDLLNGGTELMKKIRDFTDTLHTYPERLQEMFYAQLSELAADKQRDVMKLLRDGIDPFEAISQILATAQEITDTPSEADGLTARLAELAGASLDGSRRPIAKPRQHLPGRTLVRETSV
jgi:insecticidal toxin complex protein TccC